MNNNKSLTEGAAYVTGRVYLYFPAFITPKSYMDDPKNPEKYSTMIIMDKKSPDVENIIKIIKNEWKLGKIPQSGINPLKDGDKKVEERELEGKGPSIYAGNYCLFCSSKFKIKVVDSARNVWNGEDSDINGWVGRVKILFKAFSNGSNKGVTCYLQAAQVIEPGLEIGQDHTAEFEVESTVEDDDLPF